MYDISDSVDIHSEGGLSHPTIHQGTALDILHTLHYTERPGYIAQSALDILYTVQYTEHPEYIAQSALDILHRAHNSQKFKAQARKLPSIALENIDPRTALRVQNSQMQVSPKGKLPTTQH